VFSFVESTRKPCRSLRRLETRCHTTTADCREGLCFPIDENLLWQSLRHKALAKSRVVSPPFLPGLGHSSFARFLHGPRFLAIGSCGIVPRDDRLRHGCPQGRGAALRDRRRADGLAWLSNASRARKNRKRREGPSLAVMVAVWERAELVGRRAVSARQEPRPPVENRVP